MPSQSSPVYRSEERFVEMFQDLFGPAAAAKLVPQYGYLDLDEKERYIDFALESLLDRFAIEIDGETYHHRGVLTSADYAQQLIRQNSLVHLGWRVLRWSDWQLQNESESVKEHLAVLLDTAVRLVVPQDHLPCKRSALLDLHEHQKEALERLEALRKEGIQIALLAHAVGAGKTTTAVEDARVFGKRTLFVAHTIELVEQALNRFKELWPEAPAARLGDADDLEALVVVGTVQSMRGDLSRVKSEHFDYIVIDEAHHATAPLYQAILRYFNPSFLLGLTGTPDRADGSNALDVFKHAAHRMDLETAVRSKVLCDVRCFRVETNVDLRTIRFNGTMYKQADIERSVRIPERDALIVDTYCGNVKGRHGVAFCVSVAHAEEVARRFQEAGVPAAPVSGQLSPDQRQSVLRRYQSGDIRVLCACDVLNEGWDAPQTEVLLMARPTLSRVIYQQQLGRGMRKSEGKEYLILFDFVDAFSRHNRALSLNRLLRRATYRAGASVFSEDKDSLPDELPLHLWSTDLQQIDIFDWQERVEGMVTAEAMSRLLRKSEEWVRSRYLRGELAADEVVDLGGSHRIPYFRIERLAEIRALYGIAEVTDAELFTDFLRFLGAMDMTFSYKPVWFRALLQLADGRGRAKVTDVCAAFHSFYQLRAAQDETVEKPLSKMNKPASLQLRDVQQVINEGPFNRFSRLDFVGYAADRAYYQINKYVWQHLKNQVEITKAIGICEQSIASYYMRL